MALPRKNRIRSKKDIDLVFRNGRTVKGSFLFIRYLDNRKGYARFAFIIPTKFVPLAVDRNKIKRMLSGKVVMMPALSECGCDIIVGMAKKVAREEFDGLVEELRELLFKIWKK